MTKVTQPKKFTCHLYPDMWSDGITGTWTRPAADVAWQAAQDEFPDVQFVVHRGAGLRSVAVEPPAGHRYTDEWEAEAVEQDVDRFTTDAMNQFDLQGLTPTGWDAVQASAGREE